MKKMRLSNGQWFDPTHGHNYNLVEDFLDGYNVSQEVLDFATDMYGVSKGIDDILDYYDLEDEFEEYLKDNRKGYILDEDEDEDEQDS